MLLLLFIRRRPSPQSVDRRRKRAVAQREPDGVRNGQILADGARHDRMLYVSFGIWESLDCLTESTMLAG